MSPLEPREIWQFDTVHVGRRVLNYDRVDSTNNLAAQLANTESDDFAIVADFQSAGRGQYGRAWQSRPGSSLLMSVVLRPPLALRRPVILTAFASVAVAEVVFALTGAQARIKWPNDLLIHDKKCCGLLIELHGEAAIIGIGLNLNQTTEDFGALGLPDATSLGILARKRFDTRPVCEILLRGLDREFNRLVRGEQVAVEAEWKWRTGLLGHHVEIELIGGEKVHGRLREMGFDGLEIEVDHGFFQTLLPEKIAHVSRRSLLM